MNTRSNLNCETYKILADWWNIIKMDCKNIFNIKKTHVMYHSNLLFGVWHICHFDTLSLTHYSPMLFFYTPWNHQKTFMFFNVFRGYIKAIPDCNRLIYIDLRCGVGWTLFEEFRRVRGRVPSEISAATQLHPDTIFFLRFLAKH